ncbi:DUF5988 family protein [Streptomyces sp. NPDC050263]|uniref:DUF5988 family protein n=1 Tax=Streptomyces sp. NPDC050263 TaxID=3155037 RepID=UPI0034383FB6
MAQTPNVILEGGGPLIPSAERIRFLPNTAETFKLFLGNRHEHYEPTDTRQAHHDGRELRVFRRVRRTYVAEQRVRAAGGRRPAPRAGAARSLRRAWPPA